MADTMLPKLVSSPYSKPTLTSFRLAFTPPCRLALIPVMSSASRVTADCIGRPTVTTLWLEVAWFGSFMLLWRPPTGEEPVSLGRGSQGEDVAWLRNSLAAIDGRTARRPSPGGARPARR